MEQMAVIHKQVISMASSIIVDAQTFEVPHDAEMVEINWDTRDLHGIAFWYRIIQEGDDPQGHKVKYWRFLIRGTGHLFPEECTHLATVVRDGFAWHVLDPDGDNIDWAEL